ncbi:MAG: ExeA family protein [Planctomycetota bacterium]
MTRCVERQQGVGLLVGPAGTGKSLLCQVLAEQFRRSHRVALLADSRLSTRRCLWRSVSLALEMPARGRDEDELRLALTRSIESPNDATAGLVLIVDEAQSLPPRLLEELRSLTNSLRRGQPRAHLVLAGSPSLEEHCAHHKLESLNQRIAARCYLQSFGRQETREYVRRQLAAAAADGRGDLFDETALEAVFRATDGVPRLVNQVCDLALIQAADMRIPRLSARQIEEAWTEIQQFPPTWSGSQGAAARTPSTASVSIVGGSILAVEDVADRGSTNHGAADLLTRDKVVGGMSAGAEAAAVAANFIEFGALPEDGAAVVEPPPTAGLAERPGVVEEQVGPPPVIEKVERSDGPIWEKLFGDGFTETQPVADHYAALATRASNVELTADATGESSPGLESEPIAHPTAGLPAEMTAELTTDLTFDGGTDLIADSTANEVDARSIASEELPEPMSDDFAENLAEEFVGGRIGNDGASLLANPSSGAALSAEEALIAAMRSLPAVDDPRRWPPGGILQGGASSLGANESSEPLPPAATPDMETALKGMGRQYLLSLPRDDRDLLVVDDEPTRQNGRQGDTASETGGERGRDQGRARRQEYRLLFSRLRRG